MQTYTHLNLGLLMGVILFPDSHLGQGIVAAGSLFPDVPNAIKMVMDKARGKKPFADLDRSMVTNNVAHSFFVWMVIIGACVFFAKEILPLCIGALLHLVVDRLTHKDKQFAKTDQKLFWPLKITTKGVWEYRYDHGVLRPKPFELAINIVAIITTITLVVMRVIFYSKFIFSAIW